MKWEEIELGKVLDYEQPTKYIVDSSEYKGDENNTPVLTAGKTFVLGYTTEKGGIFRDNLPVIIFDDFTTAIKFVDFPFKVKSSAMKILHVDESVADAKYLYYAMQSINFKVRKHKRHWISEYSKIKIPLPSLPEQKKIVTDLNTLFAGIDRATEINASQYRRSISLKNSLVSHITNDRGAWSEFALGDLLEPVSEQIQPKDFGECDYVGLEHINGSEIDLSQVGASSEVRSAKWRFKPNDILYGKLRPYLNKCVVANRDGICSTDILVLRAKESVSAKYVAYQMKAQDFVSFSNSTVSGMNLPRTTWTKIKDYKLRMPVNQDGSIDVEKQGKLVNELDNGFVLSEKLQLMFSKQGSSLADLQTSMIQNIFRKENEAVLSPIQIAVPQLSNLQHAIGLTLKRFPRGEMVVAKVLYLAQSIFKVPLGVSFTQEAFGPYSFDIKTAIDDGLSSQKGIFVKKGTKGMEVLSLSIVGTNALNQLSGGVKKPMEDYLNVMMPLYFSSKSNSIELLATICKIIEDEKTSDDQVIYKKLQKWKPNKFGDSEIYRTISLIKKQKWDQKILQV